MNEKVKQSYEGVIRKLSDKIAILEIDLAVSRTNLEIANQEILDLRAKLEQSKDSSEVETHE